MKSNPMSMLKKLIRVDDKTLDELKALKMIPEEPYNSVIKRLIEEHKSKK